MKKTISLLSVAASVILLTACNSQPKPDMSVKWETLEYKPQLEACSDIDKKYLKSYSFMQLLEELGEREGLNFIFTPSSEDVFVQNISFRSWSDALFWLDQQKEYNVKVYGYASKNVVKTVEIKKITPSFFDMQNDSQITKTKNGLVRSKIGRIKISSDEIADSLIDFTDDYDFSNKYLTTERFLNDFYYAHQDSSKTPLFFKYDKKSKSIILTSQPEQVFMTPYKMRIFKNFLDVNSITYIESKDKKRLVIDDNYLLWKKSQDYLKQINKYSNNVYGVKTDEGYYEIADGKYPATPLAIELITWTPYGEREYNVYYGNESRKIVTSDRDFVFFTKDTHKKFTVRTY